MKRDTSMMEEEDHDTEHRQDSMFMTKKEVVSTRQHSNSTASLLVFLYHLMVSANLRNDVNQSCL